MEKTRTLSRRRFTAEAVAAMALGGSAALSAGLTTHNDEENPGGDAMATLTPYLLFDGDCRQAMEFYQTCFGGELKVMKVKETAAKDFMPPSQYEKTINARLVSGKIEISASDWLRPDRERVPGNTVCLYLNGTTEEELRLLFGRLAEGGNVTDPLKEMFFGLYGALNDRFGVRWMFQSNDRS